MQKIVYLSKKLRIFFIITFTYLHFTGCSVGIDPTEDPVQPSTLDANANEAAEEEDENQENNSNTTNNFNNTEEQTAQNAENSNSNTNSNKNTESPNNSSEENFLNGNGNLFTNNQGNNNLLGNKGNNNLGLEQNAQGEDELVNGAEGNGIQEKNLANNPKNENTNINTAATDNTLTEPQEENTVIQPEASETVSTSDEKAPSPVSNSFLNGVVKYVMAGGSKLHSKPNGDVVKDLEQGDHPLVNAEGEWSRTSDGYYVPSQTLTTEPIGRQKQPKDWR